MSSYCCRSGDSRYEFNDHWIGLMRGWIDDCDCVAVDHICAPCRASYAWTDGKPVDYDGWSAAIEPGPQDCVRLKTDGWTAEPCETFMQYICEKGK